jgi:hypothetical protein
LQKSGALSESMPWMFGGFQDRRRSL